MGSFLYNSFNAGELGDKVRTRVDLQKYHSGCRVLENFFPTPWGGVENRPGMLYVADARPKSESDGIWLIPFEYSLDQSYLIEATDGLFRIFRAGTLVATVNTPYASGEVHLLSFVQSNDVMFLAHPNHPPAMLKRMTQTSFVYEVMPLVGGPYMDEDTRGIVLTASGTTGSITLNANAALFTSDMTGETIRFAMPLAVNTINKTFTSDGTSDTTLVHRGKWAIATYGSWVGTLHLEQSFDGGATWHFFRDYFVNADRNISESGFEEEKALYRLRFSGWQDPPSGTIYECRASFQSENYETYGVVKITGVTDATHASASVLEVLPGTTSDAWSMGSFSNYTGYPALVAFSGGDRLVFARTYREPNRLWLSKVGDYVNFYGYTNADSAMQTSLRIGSAAGNITGNAINFIANSKQNIIVGSAAEIGTLAPRSTDSPLGPENFRYSVEVNPGAGFFPPIMINDVLLFVRRGGENLMELTYQYTTDGFVAPDLTILRSDILREGGGLKQMVYLELPYPVLHLLRHDGVIASFTYNRSENVTAWSRQVTDGKILSICTLPAADGYDELYLAVERDGKRYIEKLTKRDDTSDTSGVWYDNAVAVTGGTGFSGVTRFAGKTVKAKLDGTQCDLVFDADGNADFGKTVGVASAGIPYVSTLEPLPMEMADGVNSTFFFKKRICRARLEYHNSAGGAVQVNDGTEFPLVFREMSDMGAGPISVKSGGKEILLSGKFNNDKTIKVRQRDPFPLTVLAVVAENEIVNS